MNDQLDFSELLARLDRASERMNAGLAAFAAALALVVLCLSVLRASDVAIELGTAAQAAGITMPGDPSALTFWTYY